ncbi:MAG: hypothetical protein A3K19_29140 [Lentisphaerae bacterium RIFOXYB12_FULL_65_16]|nr:MAG: hypothetical protein A3K18_04530 [Lentisphaerae bacterium RIFOXYA12_64_32]OGV88364.1 MAG: hypothetical protein A3K19_29140 [Lentisphaerae bacterium RIFOXYB12_FULL_65_16]
MTGHIRCKQGTPSAACGMMLADLRRSGLTPDHVARLGWRSTESGYVIPFMDPASGKPLLTPDGKPFLRTRLAKPGATCKYISPKGAGVHPFITTDVHRHLTENGAAPVIITEGEKKSLAASLTGVPTIGLTGVDCWMQGKGKRTLHPLLSRYMTPGRAVVMVYDSDGTDAEKVTTFDRSAGRFAAAVEAAGASFSRVFMPALNGAKVGMDDFLVSGRTGADLQAYLNEHKQPVRPRRPQIMLPGGARPNIEFVREVSAVIGPHHSLFIRGGELVAVEAGEVGAPEFVTLTPAAAVSELELFATFARPGKDGETVPATLPEAVARMLLAAPEFDRRMPAIKRLCDYPQPIMHAGKIVLPPLGYSAELQTWTREDAPTLERFATPAAACTALAEILSDFCFAAGPEDKPELFSAAALAYLLTAHCRLLFEPERAPLFYAEGNRPGCGKDLLLGLAVVLTQGTLPTFFPPVKDADESRKRLFSLARAGSRFYLLSNAKGHLEDSSLEEACTSPVIGDRVLGESTNRSFPNTAIYGLSGNGLTYSEDLARRCLRLRLEYHGESTETRTFEHPDLYGFALARRGRYLGALQSLVSHWQAAGCADGSKRKASFTRWAAVIGGILEAADIYNPIGEDDIITAPTEEVQHMRKLLAAWNEARGAAEVDAGTVRELARENELFPWIEFENRPGQTKFSRMLSRHVRRSFGGLCVLKREAAKGNCMWRVATAEVTP